MPREPDPSRDPAYLEDMLVAAQAMKSFTKGRTQGEYMCDPLLRSAVERQIEIIGEAARRVSPQTKSQHPEIPWSAIQAQRHRLAHEYDEVDDTLIWTVATTHAPALIESLRKIIPPEST